MINNIIKYTICYLAVTFVFISCEEKVTERFSGDSSLYFYRDMYSANEAGVMQNDSIDYSFFLAGSEQETTIWLQVNLTGNVVDYDREILIRQTNLDEVNAAIAGTHYVDFNDQRVSEYMFLPANKTSTLIPVILTRTTTMDDLSFRLVLSILPNQDFTQGIEEDTEGQSSFIINITAKVMKPVTWDRNYDYAFGTWGEEKMKFLIDYVGFTDFNIDMSNLEARYFWNLKAKTTLKDYESENGVLYESDGITKVVFP